MSERAYGVAAEVQRNLDELERRYIQLEMKAGAKHGLAIGIIIYLNLEIWGII